MIDMGLPPSPSAVYGTCELNLLKKFSFQSASRALKELGPNDPKLNLKMAESLLTISANQFLDKWNFNTITMKPTVGRYEWVPVQHESRPLCELKVSEPINEDRTLKQKCNETCPIKTRPIDSTGTCIVIGQQSKQTLTENIDIKLNVPIRPKELLPKRSYQKKIKRIAKQKLKPRPTTPKSIGRQPKITEFGKTRKRLNSTSKSSEVDLEEVAAIPRKKLILESPLKT
ncbi:hypothetical protein Avbf_01100 [Armadillidium vulgare]|nr:hypothetical protein Avbf_01100 [Armadillidium vulgare]